MIEQSINYRLAIDNEPDQMSSLIRTASQYAGTDFGMDKLYERNAAN